MTRFKDFGNGNVDPNALPISFKLHGQEFHCVKQLQGKTMLELISASSSDDPTRNADSINLFFSRALLDESYKRFAELQDDPEKIVSVETLSEITSWLIEEYSNRPTDRPAAS
jgi:hypothetical protein